MRPDDAVRRLAPLAACLALACQPALPDDVDCAGRVLVADSDAALGRALAEARAGDCVVLRAGTYRGDRSVPAQVVLTGERDGEARVEGGEATAALRLEAGGAEAAHLALVDGTGLGLWISAPGTRARALTVDGFNQGAVGIRCQDAGCAGDDGWIEIEDCTLTRSRYGVGLAAGQLRLRGAHLAQHRSTGLSGGIGLFATGDSTLEVQGGEVRGCDLGLVLDGAGVRADLQDLTVVDNTDRGLWAQGLRGVAADPALRLHGSQTRIENNGYVGLGLHDTQGVRVEAARIAATQARPVPVELGTVEEIGDGLAVLAGSAQLVVDGATLEGSPRSQVLIDHGGADIQVSPATTVRASGTQYRVVIQNTQASVDVPAALVSAAPELAVRGEPRVSVPELGVP